MSKSINEDETLMQKPSKNPPIWSSFSSKRSPGKSSYYDHLWKCLKSKNCLEIFYEKISQRNYNLEYEIVEY